MINLFGQNLEISYVHKFRFVCFFPETCLFLIIIFILILKFPFSLWDVNKYYFRTNLIFFGMIYHGKRTNQMHAELYLMNLFLLLKLIVIHEKLFVFCLDGLLIDLVSGLVFWSYHFFCSGRLQIILFNCHHLLLKKLKKLQ